MVFIYMTHSFQYPFSKFLTRFSQGCAVEVCIPICPYLLRQGVTFSNQFNVPLGNMVNSWIMKMGFEE